VAGDFTAAVLGAPLSIERVEALLLMTDWDGHFVAGGELAWASGMERSEGWILMDGAGDPVFDDHFFSLTPEFDSFAPRSFPLF